MGRDQKWTRRAGCPVDRRPIVVATIVVVVLAVLAVKLFLVRMRRRRRLNQPASTTGYSSVADMQSHDRSMSRTVADLHDGLR